MDKKNVLMSTAIAGVMALGLHASLAQAADAKPTDQGTCKQTNDCKGKGGCASVDGKNGCAGKNECGGHEFKGTKKQCDDKGGSFTPTAQK